MRCPRSGGLWQPVIIAANKWDLVKSKGPEFYKTFDERLRAEIDVGALDFIANRRKRFARVHIRDLDAFISKFIEPTENVVAGNLSVERRDQPVEPALGQERHQHGLGARDDFG